MAYKGTVFKVNPNSLIVATGEFEFKEITKHGHAKPGQEITFEPHDILQTRSRKKKTPVAIVASLLVILLISTGMLRNFFVSDVYAYVGMDINPSIELAINKYLKVSEAEARDADAQRILQNTSLTGLEISEAIGTVLKSCSDLGYINDTTSDIMITTTIKALNKNKTSNSQTIKEKDDWTIDLETQIISGTQEELLNKPQDVNVYLVNIEPEERTQALNNSVSTGRYYLWNKAKEHSSDLTLDKINKQSISESVKNNESIRTVLDNSSVRKWNKSDLTSRSKSSLNQQTVKELKPVYSLNKNITSKNNNSSSSNSYTKNRINTNDNSKFNSYTNSKINTNDKSKFNNYINSRINNNDNNSFNSYMNSRINNNDNSRFNSNTNNNNNNNKNINSNNNSSSNKDNKSINSNNKSNSNSNNKNTNSKNNLKPSGINNNPQLRKDAKPRLEKSRRSGLDNSYLRGTDQIKDDEQSSNPANKNLSEKSKPANQSLNASHRWQPANLYLSPLGSTKKQRDNSLSYYGFQNQNMQYPYENRYNENKPASLPRDLSGTEKTNSRPARN